MIQTKSIGLIALLAGACLGVACAEQKQSDADVGGGDHPDGGVVDDGGGIDIDGGNDDDGGGIDVGGDGVDFGVPWQYDDGTDAPSYKDPGFGDDVSTYFTGTPSTAGGPVLAYPLNNSLHPNNIANILFQWDSGVNIVVRIDVQVGDVVHHLYMSCPNGGQCKNPMPKAEWYDLGQTYHGQVATITLNGVESKGGPIHVSAPYTITFSPDPVEGAFYYWSSGTAAVNRATLGADQAVPFITPKSYTNSYACTACHSVSRDGKVIAFAVSASGGENLAGIQVASTEDPTNPIVLPTKGTDGNPTDQVGSIVALSPDGSIAAINGIEHGSYNTDDTFFEMRDATTGTQIMKYYMDDNAGIFGGGNLPLFPEFSPDGKHIAVQMSYHNDWDPPIACFWYNNSCASGISVLDVAEDGTLEASRDIILQEWYGNKTVHYYPTWSPDGQYIAFMSGRMQDSGLDSGTGTFQNKAGMIRIVRADAPSGTACPSADCWELTQGTGYSPMGAADAFHTTWPKFTPFAQGENEDLLFISMTTSRPYGFEVKDQSQIWMFAVDMAKLESGIDASYAPIWLPYQQVTEENLSPYWTEQLPCTLSEDGECTGCAEGEECIANEALTTCYCAAIVK